MTVKRPKRSEPGGSLDAGAIDPFYESAPKHWTPAAGRGSEKIRRLQRAPRRPGRPARPELFRTNHRRMQDTPPRSRLWLQHCLSRPVQEQTMMYEATGSRRESAWNVPLPRSDGGARDAARGDRARQTAHAGGLRDAPAPPSRAAPGRPRRDVCGTGGRLRPGRRLHRRLRSRSTASTPCASWWARCASGRREHASSW